VVLLIVDASDAFEIFYKKFNASYNELIEIGVESSILIILNKIDLISEKNLKDKINYLNNNTIFKQRKIIPISVKNKINIKILLDEVYSSLPNIVKFNIKLPNNKKTQSLINWIYNRAYVSEISYGNTIIITIECNVTIRDLIFSKI
ncbi:MAG: hypothetical protein LN408_05525, partial [Candidatus Thermoplasmatota archaeon]|nr:hypothetical protein [Candidatus Thermoplasmatota archaeon]